MRLGDMYPAVLTLVLIGIILGVGLTVLGNLASNTGLTNAAAVAVNSTIGAVDDFPTWLGIIVIVIAAAIIIGLVTGSFGGGSGQR